MSSRKAIFGASAVGALVSLLLLRTIVHHLPTSLSHSLLVLGAGYILAVLLAWALASSLLPLMSWLGGGRR